MTKMISVVKVSARHLRWLPSWRLMSNRTANFRVVEKISPPLRLVGGRRRGRGDAQKPVWEAN